MEHSGFPSDETLAAFIDGRLDEVTRRRVVEHMTTCDECYAVYLAATEMHAASPAPSRRRRAISGSFLAATLTMSIAAIVIVALLLHRTDPLVAAAGEMPYRTVEGRLTGGFAWKPLHEVERGKPSDLQKDSRKWGLLDAALKVRQGAQGKEMTPENLHALGVSHLLIGNWDEAITLLKSASEERPDDANFANDLATAYLARGAFRESAQDYADANEVAAKAWALKKSPETAWTRAMVMEHLHLPDARFAWNDYLKLDPSSPWSDEAREHLHALNAPSDASEWMRVKPDVERAARKDDRVTIDQFATRFPQQVAAFGDELLARWANGGDTKQLAAAAAIGHVIASHGFGALEATIEAPLSREAIRELDRGRALFNVGNYDAAGAAFRKSRELALGVHSPVAQVATIELAVSLYRQVDYDGTSEQLDLWDREMHDAPWRSTAVAYQGRALFLRGLVHFERGHPHDALKSYKAALELIQQAGHRDWEAALDALLAQNCDALGDSEHGWQYRAEALRLASRLGNPGRLQYVLVEATIAAVMQQKKALSDTLTNRMIVVATNQDGGFLEDAHIWRARVLRDTGPDALHELHNARAAAERIPDDDARDRAIANIDMATGDILARITPQLAIRHLSDALQFLDARGNHLLRAEVFDARARAYETIRRRDLASADRESALDEIEAQRERIDDSQLRADFVHVARKLYTDAIDLAVASRDYGRAFDLAERSRATTAGVAPAMSVERLREILPAGVALIEYMALPRRTVAWIVRREGVTATILPLHGNEISAATERMIETRTDRRSFDVAAGEVYTQIVAALRPHLSDVQTAAFVPDPTWPRVPFAALVDPASRRHLFEDMDVVTDTSAAHFAAAVQRTARSGGAPHMLVCADPDAVEAPRLLAARREGDLIARTFGASILSGNTATREEFVSKAPTATVIHFAGHAQSDPHDSDYSALLFSSDGKLYAWEIRKLKLARTRLVVLAACDTGAISDAFLAAGAPAAVATLWDIGDSHGQALMTKMYQRLHDGDSPSHALRAAQLAALHDPGARPADWAGFELIGL